MKVIMSVLSFAAVVLQSATGAAVERCVFNIYGVTTVAPYHDEENVGYGSYTRLRGAQLFVPARRV